MVGMIVDGPLRQNRVGIFSGNSILEIIVVSRIDYRLSIHLSAICGPCLQDLARLCRFGLARGG